MIKKSRKSSGEITNRMLLEHMQAGKEELKNELQKVEKSLRGDIKRLDERIKQCERNDEKTHIALQRLYEKRIVVVEKIEDHEKRITTIEKELATAA